jgi:hypothetical protein
MIIAVDLPVFSPIVLFVVVNLIAERKRSMRRRC